MVTSWKSGRRIWRFFDRGQ